jgi:hypothetical protein
MPRVRERTRTTSIDDPFARTVVQWSHLAKHLQRLLLLVYRVAVRSGALELPGMRSVFDACYDIYKRLIEAPHVHALRAHVQPGTIVVDVGANVGFFTRYFAEWTGADGRVLAIEAERQNFERLKAMIQSRRLDAVVRSTRRGRGARGHSRPDRRSISPRRALPVPRGHPDASCHHRRSRPPATQPNRLVHQDRCPGCRVARAARRNVDAAVITSRAARRARRRSLALAGGIRRGRCGVSRIVWVSGPAAVVQRALPGALGRKELIAASLAHEYIEALFTSTADRYRTNSS